MTSVHHHHTNPKRVYNRRPNAQCRWALASVLVTRVQIPPFGWWPNFLLAVHSVDVYTLLILVTYSVRNKANETNGERLWEGVDLHIRSQFFSIWLAADYFFPISFFFLNKTDRLPFGVKKKDRTHVRFGIGCRFTDKFHTRRFRNAKQQTVDGFRPIKCLHVKLVNIAMWLFERFVQRLTRKVIKFTFWFTLPAAKNIFAHYNLWAIRLACGLVLRKIYIKPNSLGCSALKWLVIHSDREDRFSPAAFDSLPIRTRCVSRPSLLPLIFIVNIYAMPVSE